MKQGNSLTTAFVIGICISFVASGGSLHAFSKQNAVMESSDRCLCRGSSVNAMGSLGIWKRTAQRACNV
jgi:hypothetical protein